MTANGERAGQQEVDPKTTVGDPAAIGGCSAISAPAWMAVEAAAAMLKL